MSIKEIASSIITLISPFAIQLFPFGVLFVPSWFILRRLPLAYLASLAVQIESTVLQKSSTSRRITS